MADVVVTPEDEDVWQAALNAWWPNGRLMEARNTQAALALIAAIAKSMEAGQ